MKRNRFATQGRLLIERLKARPHTYMDMLKHGISVSPWKRISESLKPEEKLIKGTNARGLTTWRVSRA